MNWAPSQYMYKKTHFPVLDLHCKDKTVTKPSFLYNGNPYTGKMVSVDVLMFNSDAPDLNART